MHLKKIYIIISIFIFNINLYSQRVSNYQEYKYQGEDIEFTLSSNKQISENDILKFRLSLINISVDTLYFIICPNYMINLSQNKMIIDYGGSYEAKLDNIDSLYIVNPSDTLIHNFIYDINPLLKEGLKNYFQVVIDIGYTCKVNIENCKNVSDEILIKGNNIIILNNSIIDCAMRRQAFGCYSISFK